jgi:hypothetical protein
LYRDPNNESALWNIIHFLESHDQYDNIHGKILWHIYYDNSMAHNDVNDNIIHNFTKFQNYIHSDFYKNWWPRQKRKRKVINGRSWNQVIHESNKNWTYGWLW